MSMNLFLQMILMNILNERKYDKVIKKLKVKTKEQKIIKAYIFIAILFTITFGTSKIVLATDDPLEVVNNLSDLIFRMVKIIGIIMTGFGFVQFGLSFKSHDSSQRANSVLGIIGGLIITFSKELIDAITK